MGALIEAKGLSKRFGKVQALSDLTLTLPAGQPVAILGPNGAGKTTFIRMIATLIEPIAGRSTRGRPRRGARADGGAPHDRPGRPVRRGRGDDDRAGEPADGGPPVRPGEEGGGGLGQRGSSNAWTWRTRRTARCARTRGACGGGSTSGPAWPGRPGCCCSTSRRPGSIRGVATRCGTPSVRWAGPGPTCC